MSKLRKFLGALAAAATALTGGAALAADIPLVLLIEFGKPSTPIGANQDKAVSLTYILGNSNPGFDIGSVTFINNTLPAGLVIADPPYPAPVSNTCNFGGTPGTLTANPGSSTVSYVGAVVKAQQGATAGNCLITIWVRGTTAGNKTVSERASSDHGPSQAFTPPDTLVDDATSASILVLGPPTLTKSFGTSPILVDQWDPLESTCRHASLSIL